MIDTKNHQTCDAHIQDVWRELKEALLMHGSVAISMDMEDFGREPGDIAWVTVNEHTAFGILCEAVREAKGMADEERRLLLAAHAATEARQARK